MKKKVEKTVRIDCNKCKSQHDCCQTGAWMDLEEAKKVVERGINRMFYHLEIDKKFPSGFRIGTSYEYNSCSFLDPDGLCSIHKVDYALKPRSCKEFPFEGGSLSPDAGDLCTLYKSRSKKQK